MLGETGWRVNKRVLEVVEKLWKAGGGIADLVEADDVSFCSSIDSVCFICGQNKRSQFSNVLLRGLNLQTLKLFWEL